MGVLRTDENDSVFTRLRAFPLTGPFDGNIVDTTADFHFFSVGIILRILFPICIRRRNRY